jgi:hypothetical protein
MRGWKESSKSSTQRSRDSIRKSTVWTKGVNQRIDSLDLKLTERIDNLDEKFTKRIDGVEKRIEWVDKRIDDLSQWMDVAQRLATVEAKVNQGARIQEVSDSPNCAVDWRRKKSFTLRSLFLGIRLGALR